MSCQILIHSVYKHNSPGSFTLIRLKQTPGLRRFLARPTRKLQYYPKPLQDGLHLTRERPRFGVGTGLDFEKPCPELTLKSCIQWPPHSNQLWKHQAWPLGPVPQFPHVSSKHTASFYSECLWLTLWDVHFLVGTTCLKSSTENLFPIEVI